MRRHGNLHRDLGGGNTRLFLAAVFALILFRIGLVILLQIRGGMPLQPDSQGYLDLVPGLVEAGWFSSGGAEQFVPEVFRTPGYPIYLALFRWCGVGGTTGPLLGQEIIYLLVAGLFFLGTRRLLDERLAGALLVFLLIEPGGIAQPKVIMSDTLNLLFLIPAVLALGLHLKRRRWRWLLLSGLLLGLAAWVRPAALYLPLVFAPVLLITGGFRPAAFGRAAALMLVTVLVLSPWLLRNHAIFGTPYLSGQMSNMLANYHLPYVWEITRGLTFLEGQAEVTNRIAQARSQAEERIGRRLDAVEHFGLTQQIALDELVQHPAAYAQRWVIGIFKTLLGPGVLDVYDAYGFRTSRVHFSAIPESSFIAKMRIFLTGQDPLVLVEAATRLALLALAVVGALVILRSGNPVLWVILLFCTYTLVIPGPMGLARLRLAAEGFLFIQAWIGARWILNHRVRD